MRFAVLLVLFFSTNTQAVERVLDFHSEVRVAADGVLTVTEVIVVQAEGREIRRGILRDFRSEYRYAGGGFVPISGTIDLAANELYIVADGAKTVLVDRDCVANPAGPGC